MIKVDEFFIKQDTSGGFARISEVTVIKDRGQKELAKGKGELSWQAWAVSKGVAKMTINNWKMAMAVQGTTLSLRIVLYVRGNEKNG